MSDIETAATPDSAATAEKDARAIHDAFSLGWALTELTSRIQISAGAWNASPEKDPDEGDRRHLAPNSPGLRLNTETTQSADPTRLLKEQNYSFRLASIWRALFSRIITVHSEAFPKSQTTGTLYAPPGREQLPYLYPPEPDYADIGIRGVDHDNLPLLNSFGLFDVSRRAINCLTVLFVDPEESLLPTEIRATQARLVWKIRHASEPTDETSTPAETKPTDEDGRTGAEVPSPPYEPDSGYTPSEEELAQAVRCLSAWAVKFLAAWQAYARESYYTGGRIENDVSELVAFESGWSLAAVSWGLAQRLSTLEQSGQTVQSEQLKGVWRDMFDARAVVHVQHQISALSGVLDDKYHARNPTRRSPARSSELVMPDPEAPSQALQAVRHSLDYWQRTVDWVSGQSKTGGGTVYRAPDLDLRLSRQLRIALREQSDIWQSLMTGQQNLQAYTMQTVAHKILDDVLESMYAEVEQRLSASAHQAIKHARESVDSLASTFWPYLLAGFVMATLGIVMVVVLAQHAPAQAGTAGIFSAIGAGIPALLGYSSGKKQQRIARNALPDPPRLPPGPATSGDAAGSSAWISTLSNRLSDLTGEASAALVKAFQNAYQQVQVEFAELNQSVAVSYPLIEYFVMSCDEIRTDFEFLEKVIWSESDRAEELKRVAEAAFGPFRLLLASHL